MEVGHLHYAAKAAEVKQVKAECLKLCDENNLARSRFLAILKFGNAQVIWQQSIRSIDLCADIQRNFNTSKAVTSILAHKARSTIKPKKYQKDEAEKCRRVGQQNRVVALRKKLTLWFFASKCKFKRTTN